MRRLKLFGYTLGLFLAMTLTSHADVTIGAFDAPPNAFPFGNFGYLGEYQQVYAGTAFSGIANIVSLGFASSASISTGTETLNLHVGLGTTTATPFNLAGPYTANMGSDFTQVFAGSVTFTPLFNNTFDLVFHTSPFLFNPNNGNLLLDVVIDSASGSAVSFFGSTFDPATGNAFNSGGTGDPVHGEQGLVTNFGTASAVPEPNALVLLASVVGILLLGRRMRQSRATA